MPDLDEYIRGEFAVLQVTWKDQDGDEQDPTVSIKITIVHDDGTTQTTAIDETNMTSTGATGIYQYAFDTGDEALGHYRWEAWAVDGANNHESAAKGEFWLKPSLTE